MATGKVEMFSELRCTVLNGRADLDLKKIIFTFGIVFFFILFSKTGLCIHSFLLQIQVSEQGPNYWLTFRQMGNKLSLI